MVVRFHHGGADGGIYLPVGHGLGGDVFIVRHQLGGPHAGGAGKHHEVGTHIGVGAGDPPCRRRQTGSWRRSRNGLRRFRRRWSWSRRFRSRPGRIPSERRTGAERVAFSVSFESSFPKLLMEVRWGDFAVISLKPSPRGEGAPVRTLGRMRGQVLDWVRCMRGISPPALFKPSPWGPTPLVKGRCREATEGIGTGAPEGGG